MKRILVPVDFSKYSEYALKVAAQIARDLKCEIIVVHMMGLSEPLLTRDEEREVFNALSYMQITKERFTKFLDKPYLKGITVIDVVHNDKNFSELDEIATSRDAGLIVMGSHGLSGMKDIFVGSNTEKVVRSSEIPVLVIKNHIPDFKIKNAIFACDLKDDYLNSFQKTRKFLEPFNVHPRPLFVNIPERFLSNREMEAMASNFLMDAGIADADIFTEVDFYSDYTLESGIYHYCEERDIDLIVIPTHGRKGLAHFFYGSIGENVANNAKIPVLTIKI
ncbi:universal stress protein [Christiangramia fulva]|uniref:Universal stress protein n=1 Tax=Christiangramia fulva TaxID=2126553 RepID=A0A2R3Z291_9FLAO|nr:universal stress protein [Christiangramia fulva]AVR44359.1 universal stress protein [Christiangramia fulva]